MNKKLKFDFSQNEKWEAINQNDNSDATYIESIDFSYTGFLDGDTEEPIAHTQKEIHANAKLIACAPELLYELIDSILFMEDFGYPDTKNSAIIKRYYNKIKLIEKATGKTWKEIQEMLDEH